jgi:hypothetical protein
MTVAEQAIINPADWSRDCALGADLAFAGDCNADDDIGGRTSTLGIDWDSAWLPPY